MSKKTMTIHEFMEIQRIKEFNLKRKGKINKQVLVLLALVIALGVAAAGQINSNETITAFQTSNISLF